MTVKKPDKGVSALRDPSFIFTFSLKIFTSDACPVSRQNQYVNVWLAVDLTSAAPESQNFPLLMHAA